MATQIVEISSDEAALLRGYEKAIQKQLEYEQRLRDGGEAGDAAGIKTQEALARVQRAADASLRGYLGDLNKLGPEGAAAASALRDHLTSAGKAGFQSMDDVLAKIREIDPESADAAAQARLSFEEAANSTERQFEKVLDELHRMGPQGRDAANQIKRELVDAGKIAEKSMHDVVAELERIDPEAAKAARSIVTNVEDAGRRGENAFSKFGRSAVGELTSIVGAYIGVREAIDLVNQFLEKQVELIGRAKDEQIELARAQQEAAKNLAGLTVVERSNLLQQAAPDIAARTGFSDIAEITQALGSVASTGETSEKLIANAVEQAARVQRRKTEDLDTTAAAASAVQRQAGLDDIRQAIALVQTTGTQALITDPNALVKSFPQAVGAGVATVPQQDPEEAARQNAALFAQITQGGNDVQGKASATFATDFTNRLRQFFAGLSEEQIKARSQIELIDRKIAKGSDTEQDRFKRGNLQEFLAASAGIQDPGELFARLQILQSDGALSRQFKGEGFGEKQFQTVLDDLLNAQSERSALLKQSFETIQANVAFFEREASFQSSGTPELALATADSRSEANRIRRDVQDKEAAALAKVREIVGGALEETAPNFLDKFLDSFVGRGSLAGGTAAEEALEGSLQLQRRVVSLQAGGVTEREALDIERLRAEIDNLQSLVRALATQGALDSDGLERATRRATAGADREVFGEGASSMRELFVDMRDLLLEIAESNAATADNTVPAAPNVTPVLSGQE